MQFYDEMVKKLAILAGRAQAHPFKMACVGTDQSWLRQFTTPAILGQIKTFDSTNRNEEIELFGWRGWPAESSYVYTLSGRVESVVWSSLAADRVAPVVFRATFGNGAPDDLEFDAGSMVRLATSGISTVTARFDVESFDDPSLFPESVQVVANLNYMNQSGLPATRTYRRAVASGGSVIVPVPNYAQRVRVYYSDVTLTTTGVGVVTFLGGSTATAAQLGQADVYDVSRRAYTIPGGTTHVQVSKAGDPATTAVIVFELAV